MSKYKAEITAALVQLAIFWLFPLLALKAGPIGMVFFMLSGTLILSALLGGGSDNRLRYLFPLAAGLLFLPTVPVYYNSSALIHAVWYAVLSAAGIILGTVLTKSKNKKP